MNGKGSSKQVMCTFTVDSAVMGRPVETGRAKVTFTFAGKTSSVEASSAFGSYNQMLNMFGGYPREFTVKTDKATCKFVVDHATMEANEFFDGEAHAYVCNTPGPCQDWKMMVWND